MKVVNHINATSLDSAVAALAKGNAVVIAGGTDLLGELKAMISPNPPDTLVNLKTIPNLSYIKVDSGILKIGPLTKLVDIAQSSLVSGSWAALAQAAGKVAAAEIRNMGTIGGNICQPVRCWYYWGEFNAFSCLRKDPKGICYALVGDNRYHSIFGPVSGCVAVNVSDTAPALVALNATIVTNKNQIKATDFFAVNGEKTTVLASNEIVTEIQVPTPATGSKSAFMKFALRKAIDFPVVNCAVMVTAADGTVSAANVCLNAVYNMPSLVAGAGQALVGKAINDTSSTAAATAAVSGATALPYTTGTGNKYKIQIATTLVKRTVMACQ